MGRGKRRARAGAPALAAGRPPRLYFTAPAAERQALDRAGLSALQGPLRGFDSLAAAAAGRGADEEIWQLSCHRLAEGALIEPEGEGRWLLADAPLESWELLLVEQAPRAVGPCYHFAPRSARASIAAHGLDYRRGARSKTPFATRGNFLLDGQLALARILAESWCGEDADIWRVEIDGLSLERDHSASWRENSWFSREPVPASALELVEEVALRRF